MTEYFLQTRRLLIRRWTPEDLPLAITLWGDPAVTRFIDARGTLSVKQVAEHLAQEIATEREHGIQYWPLFAREDGNFVGCCGLRPYRPQDRVYELGVHIRSAHWRRGYGREAAAAVIRHAFDALGAAALFAGHHPANEASRQLLERLGFRYTHDEPYAPTGLRHPSYLLGRDDWQG